VEIDEAAHSEQLRELDTKMRAYDKILSKQKITQTVTHVAFVMSFPHMVN
jgi:hypothetical protein